MRGTVAAAVAAASAVAAAVGPLQSFPLSGVTTSGISAGAFMASQFHVAYSSIVSGAALLAGGEQLDVRRCFIRLLRIVCHVRCTPLQFYADNLRSGASLHLSVADSEMRLKATVHILTRCSRRTLLLRARRGGVRSDAMHVQSQHQCQLLDRLRAADG